MLLFVIIVNNGFAGDFCLCDIDDDKSEFARVLTVSLTQEVIVFSDYYFYLVITSLRSIRSRIEVIGADHFFLYAVVVRAIVVLVVVDGDITLCEVLFLFFGESEVVSIVVSGIVYVDNLHLDIYEALGYCHFKGVHSVNHIITVACGYLVIELTDFGKS